MKGLLYTTTLIIIAACASGCRVQVPVDNRPLMVIGVIALILLLFTLLATSSNLLRDEISNCDEFDENARKIHFRLKSNPGVKKAPYSLTKVQFGVWTVVISSSYLYLSLLKGDCANVPINKTAIVLMGIYSGLAAATAILDKREMNDNRPRHQNTPSVGFFNDILSDDNGISLHRFQNLVWTIIAIVVYLNKLSLITQGCILPELSDTLLALTGISTATYLVMKSKESDPSAQEAARSNQTGSSKQTDKDIVPTQ